MYEELYVIKNGERFQLDLNTPSGITLNFKSNLFGDLSKISCSFTYTFKLPMTRRNRQILDSAEDIRHDSGMIRKRLKAEFYQNGINLFANANLYINEITTTYSAVLTWDVNDGLEKIKEEDISLNELGLYIGDKTVLAYDFENSDHTAEEAFDNTADILRPMYNCGLPFYMFDGKKYGTSSGGRVSPAYFTSSTIFAYPLPVVPVFRLLKAIEQHFGLKCNLGKQMRAGQFAITSDEEDIITRGVIPLVGRDIEPEVLNKNSYHLNNITLYWPDMTSCELPIKTIFSFGSITKEGDIISSFLNPSTNFTIPKTNTSYGDTIPRVGVVPAMDFVKFEYNGCVTASFDYSGEEDISDPPTLSVYQLQNEWVNTYGGARGPIGRRNSFVWKEVASVEGEAVEGYSGVWRFDFAEENGQSRLECSNLQSGYPVCFMFNYKVARNSSTGQIAFQTNVPITAHLVNDAKCVASFPISLFYNLPDISCQTFLKALFYMIGAYPTLNEAGELIPKYYTEIKNNLANKKVVDWSSRDTTRPGEQPTSIKFELSDFAQKNYYLMKSDALEKKERETKDETDIFESGIGYLQVGSEVIDKEKTVIQLPFNAPFIRDKKHPSYQTGNTLKMWEMTDDELPAWTRPGSRKVIAFADPDPCYGLITNHKRTVLFDGSVSPHTDIMTMEAWNGFASLTSNPSFRYLQEIIANPYIVQIDLRLNEFDLADLDFSVPVYLEKYNAYFAVVSIQRDSKGKCKCELIKLP